MDPDPLQFSGNDPGAVTLGNFINYYDFHPPEERLKLLPDNLWLPVQNRQFTCLDIGCNTGELTTRVYDHISNIFQNSSSEPKASCVMIGIDIDPVLIQRANEKNCHSNQVIFKCLDFMSAERTQVLEECVSKCNGQFDVIFCFSITMWIHLNHGDEGLNRFLRDISEMARMLIIEPQPWKCYKSAMKRLKKSKKSLPAFEKITIRENVEQHIEIFLVQTCNFKKVYESSETKWGRRLLFFTREGSS